MKLIARTLLAVIFIFFSLFVFIVVSTLDSSPSTMQIHQLDAKAAQHSKILAKRLHQTIQRQSKMSLIRINQHEIDGLTALLHRAVPRITAQVTLSDIDAMIHATVELPLPMQFKYLNVEARLLPSQNGLWFDEVKIGSLAFNGERFFNTLIALIDYKLQSDTAKKAFNIVRSVNINRERLFIRAELDNTLIAKDNEQSILTKLRDELALLGDVNNIKFYYQSLVEFSRSQPEQHYYSLAAFVNHVFKLAKNKVAIVDNENDYSAVTENQAALVALVLYFGSDRFKLLVGEFEPLSAHDSFQQNHLRAVVKLQNRVDLQKHFIYSAALQLFSTQYASDALGEFKEFLDSNKGGSGFSFADLQADRAGTRLAMIVTESEQSALIAQDLLAKVKDNELLPSIDGLIEGINEEKFSKQYQHVNSEAYKKTIAVIDQRLKTLPLYQLGW